jgi:hypothetical protein
MNVDFSYNFAMPEKLAPSCLRQYLQYDGYQANMMHLAATHPCKECLILTGFMMQLRLWASAANAFHPSDQGFPTRCQVARITSSAVTVASRSSAFRSSVMILAASVLASRASCERIGESPITSSLEITVLMFNADILTSQ